MNRNEIMAYVAEHFNVMPDYDGTYDIESYDFTSGCSFNDKWLCLAEIVKVIENIIDDYGLE